MDWFQRAKLIFEVPRPEHFVDPLHCCECAEKDETLRAHGVDSIGRDQLGYPGSDPIAFSSVAGIMYYMPALIQLTLDTIDSPDEMYIDQFLFHLIRDGSGNELVAVCNADQRRMVSGFLEYLIGHYGPQIDARVFSADQILKAHEIWHVAE